MILRQDINKDQVPNMMQDLANATRIVSTNVFLLWLLYWKKNWILSWNLK